MHSAPIGIFDSGVGGLTIWSAIHQRLPMESLLYLADSAHAPYGERSPDEITQLSKANVEFLLGQGCKAVVVACNTATTNSITQLRTDHPDVPFIGIEPATKPAALRSASGKVGILATKGTFASDLFLHTSSPFRGKVSFVEVAGIGLVKAIESGNLESARSLLETYLEPMQKAGVDHIVLGCTHYPFLIPMIRDMVDPGVEILEPSAAIAKQLEHVLDQRSMLRQNAGGEPELKFYTTGSLDTLRQFMQMVGAAGQSERVEIES